MNNNRDLTREEMKNAEIGVIVSMGCSGCEGCEEHKKLESGKWKCLNCGRTEIEFK
jgi:hypothetical protein